MDAAVAALLGAAVGAAGSFGAMWIQQRHQTRRERLKLATDLGMRDYDSAMEHAKSRPGGASVPPLSSYVIYHADMLNELAEGEVTAATIERINKKTAELLESFPNPHKDNAKP